MIQHSIYCSINRLKVPFSRIKIHIDTHAKWNRKKIEEEENIQMTWSVSTYAAHSIHTIKMAISFGGKVQMIAWWIEANKMYINCSQFQGSFSLSIRILDFFWLVKNASYPHSYYQLDVRKWQCERKKYIIVQPKTVICILTNARRSDWADLAIPFPNANVFLVTKRKRKMENVIRFANESLGIRKRMQCWFYFLIFCRFFHQCSELPAFWIVLTIFRVPLGSRRQQ